MLLGVVHQLCNSVWHCFGPLHIPLQWRYVTWKIMHSCIQDKWNFISFKLFTKCNAKNVSRKTLSKNIYFGGNNKLTVTLYLLHTPISPTLPEFTYSNIVSVFELYSTRIIEKQCKKFVFNNCTLRNADLHAPSFKIITLWRFTIVLPFSNKSHN